jgi:hypothetical protein
MGAEKVRQFLSDLAVNHHVAASTQNRALSTILFLSQHVLRQEIGWINDVVRAKEPKKPPVVLTQAEVIIVVNSFSGSAWLMATLRCLCTSKLLWSATYSMSKSCMTRTWRRDSGTSTCRTPWSESTRVLTMNGHGNTYFPPLVVLSTRAQLSKGGIM